MESVAHILYLGEEQSDKQPFFIFQSSTGIDRINLPGLRVISLN